MILISILLRRLWTTHEYFEEEWLDDIGSHQHDLLPFELITENREWFHYIKNDADPSASRYRYVLCIYIMFKFKIRTWKGFKSAFVYLGVESVT